MQKEKKKGRGGESSSLHPLSCHEASLHFLSSSMRLALYHQRCPMVRVWLSIWSLPALLSRRLQRERKGRGKWRKRGWGDLYKLLWRCVSAEGTNELRGLPNKRRHLQQLSQLTGKLWRFANVGWQQGNLNNEACGRKETGMRRWLGGGGMGVWERRKLRKKDVWH